jgi:hypothetical protein
MTVITEVGCEGGLHSNGSKYGPVMCIKYRQIHLLVISQTHAVIGFCCVQN